MCVLCVCVRVCMEADDNNINNSTTSLGSAYTYMHNALTNEKN